MALLQIFKKPQLAKDKGYAWVILFFSFLSHFTHLGFSYGTAGNLTIAHQKVFNIDLQKGSLLGTIHVGVLMLFGESYSFCVDKEVWLQSYTDIWRSLCPGVGVSCTYSASSSILPLYFERFKYIAFAVAALGGYIAVITWPLISQYLLNKFGYSVAMGIMSTFNIIHLIAGVSFIDPQLENKNSENFRDNNLEWSNDVEGKVEVSADRDTNGGVDSKAAEFSEIDVADTFEESKSEAVVTEVPEVAAEENIQTLRQEFTILFKSPEVWLLAVSSIFWNTASSGYFVLINDYIVKNTKLNELEAALGITIAGIGNIVACITLALTGSLKLNRFILFGSSILLMSIGIFIAPFATTKAIYYTSTALYGLGIGSAVASVLAVISDLCSTQQLPLLFGIESFSKGLGVLALLPLAAYIAESTEEKYGLIFVGSCGVVGALAMLAIAVLTARKRRYS
ncbi:hypothetical protein EB796_006238 [Bugula neritina]|uniref:Major facilitator superfamily (MFS) profile domain-containing protein n=1 Tax=Bugula neritina TaxID=10212 RepID=A0A7J7KB75_BUGNE|nr:hypothetical protein EB796_006238 [Bugula neritina]